MLDVFVPHKCNEQLQPEDPIFWQLKYCKKITVKRNFKFVYALFFGKHIALLLKDYSIIWREQIPELRL